MTRIKKKFSGNIYKYWILLFLLLHVFSITMDGSRGCALTLCLCGLHSVPAATSGSAGQAWDPPQECLAAEAGALCLPLSVGTQALSRVWLMLGIPLGIEALPSSGSDRRIARV